MGKDSYTAKKEKWTSPDAVISKNDTEYAHIRKEGDKNVLQLVSPSEEYEIRPEGPETGINVVADGGAGDAVMNGKPVTGDKTHMTVTAGGKKYTLLLMSARKGSFELRDGNGGVVGTLAKNLLKRACVMSFDDDVHPVLPVFCVALQKAMDEMH